LYSIHRGVTAAVAAATQGKTGAQIDFGAVAAHPETNGAGLGYSMLRALGAGEGRSKAALELRIDLSSRVD
jgi:hypothetical protein